MTENVWCAVNTLSLSCFCLLSLLLSPFSFSLHPPSPVTHTVCYCITVTYILKKSLPVFITCVEMQSRNINIWVKNRNITTMMLRWRLTLTANICIFWFSLIFFSFFLWSLGDSWGIFSRQCLSMLLSVLTFLQCLSVCQPRSPWIEFLTCILILMFRFSTMFMYLVPFFADEWSFSLLCRLSAPKC